ncbi:hypothetical protein ACJOV8_001395 [Formosa sp. 3Alg 14/1]|uniref:hypothetical protein n=1 Tax=Formosa sp. 3Alg 14/1 TaxID=3382190 RepID=UPI0039BDE195
MNPESINYTEEEELQAQKFLETHIYNGLKNLNTGFDAEYIYYFSEADFEIILDRVEENNISIFGIEPWLDSAYYDVTTYEDYNTAANDPKWYRKAFTEFKSREKNLIYAASYRVPKSVLK